MLLYNLEYYNKTSVVGMTLNDHTQDSINTLIDIFGISTPVQPRPQHRSVPVQKHEEWKRVEQFKPTLFTKTEGIDTYISNIRTLINKLSAKTYDTHIKSIIENIDNIINTDEDIDVINKNISIISGCLFDIVSNNKFYSNIYANLFTEFVNKYEFFKDITNSIPENYINDILKINPVDQNENYDKFCEMNKDNDKRKSLITFIINLVKNNTLASSNIGHIYTQLDNIVFKSIDNPEIIEINDEIVENIFIIISNASDILHKQPLWETIKTQINTISKYKPKEHPGLSSRAKFKYMDMATIVNKIV